MPSPSPLPETALASDDARNLRGAMWIIVSCFGATIMSVSVRLLSEDLHTVQLAFLRSVLGLWVLIPIFLLPGKNAEREERRIRFSRPELHLARGLLFVGAVNMGFYALSVLPLATATTLFFLAPIFTTSLAALFTSEKVGPRRWAAVFAGFVGALIVLRPGFAVIEPAMLSAIGSSLLFAVALIITRPLAKADGANSIMVSTSVIAGILLLAPALWVWREVSFQLVPLILLMTLSASLRLFADIRAYSTADVGFLAPFAFMRLLFIVVAGWIVFREGVDGPVALGALVIIGAGVFIARREAQLRRVGRA